MEYRLNRQALLDTLRMWDTFLKKKVHLIACGGTALTLLGVKPTTKDVDIIVPDVNEYKYLTDVLADLGYKRVTGAGWSRGDGFIFDIFFGNRIHTTELLCSPLEGNILVQEFERIYLGVLNYYDVLISKLFRGTGIDFEDCLMLVLSKRNEINLSRLVERFRETASYDILEDSVIKNLEYFLKKLESEGVEW
jgi:hypothetical protein